MNHNTRSLARCLPPRLHKVHVKEAAFPGSNQSLSISERMEAQRNSIQLKRLELVVALLQDRVQSMKVVESFQAASITRLQASLNRANSTSPTLTTSNSSSQETGPLSMAPCTPPKRRKVTLKEAPRTQEASSRSTFR